MKEEGRLRSRGWIAGCFHEGWKETLSTDRGQSTIRNVLCMPFDTTRIRLVSPIVEHIVRRGVFSMQREHRHLLAPPLKPGTLPLKPFNPNSNVPPTAPAPPMSRQAFPNSQCDKSLNRVSKSVGARRLRFQFQLEGAWWCKVWPRDVVTEGAI